MGENIHDVDVLIVGGGISGLVAAYELNVLNIGTRILEATNRLGGRCGGDLDVWGVEAGAEFIHGENAITWQYLDMFGIGASPFPESPFNFRKYDPDSPQLGVIVDWICEKCEAENSLSSGSLQQFIDALVPSEDEKLPFTLAEFAACWDIAKAYASERIERIEGCSLEDLPHASYVEQSLLSSTATRNFRIDSGYRDLVGNLAKKSEVEFNFEVSAIRDKGTIVAVESLSGQILTARRVVVTTPFEQLTSGKILFEPGLPKEKLDAMARIPLGIATKVTAGLKLSNALGFEMLHTLGLIPTWFNLGFDADTRIATVLGFCGGSHASRLNEMSESDAKLAIVAELCTYVEGLDLTMIQDQVVIHRWDNAPYIHGAYSYPKCDGVSAALRVSRPEGKIHFAGEATSFNGNIGTVHGAIESGLRVFREIEKSLKP